VSKRTLLEEFVPGVSRGVLLLTVFDEGRRELGNPPGRVLSMNLHCERGHLEPVRIIECVSENECVMTHS